MIFGLSVVFLLIALVTVAGALAAALLRNLVHCALSLTVTFAGLALMYLQLDAQFAGFAQILVYIGAVAILVVFAILLTRGAGTQMHQAYSSSWLLGLVIAAAVFALLAWAVMKSLPSAVATATPVVSVKSIGYALMGNYVLPLEIVAVLLTVALLGAVIVAMPDVRRKGGVQ
ncbi:NADH-quinone oxidoreductase subunit J family protein [Acidicapsa ligni]|uniref:NADH-quinone oxidoreductase subunit J family protein n=1 Tax=Acidicapsa ligni TaxID=542300 RepID=UPI0021E0D065|nr:NADH-quinone oxidoreductase subunit J [Acidicapsa ligni]